MRYVKQIKNEIKSQKPPFSFKRNKRKPLGAFGGVGCWLPSSAVPILIHARKVFWKGLKETLFSKKVSLIKVGGETFSKKLVPNKERGVPILLIRGCHFFSSLSGKHHNNLHKPNFCVIIEPL